MGTITARRARGLVLIALLVGAAAGGEALLPGWASRRLERAFLAFADGARTLEVQVESRPGYRLALGSVDRLILEGEGLVINGIEVAEARLQGEGVVVQWRGGSAVPLRSARRLDLTLVLGQEALNRLLARAGEPWEGFGLVLTPEGAQVRGELSLFGRQVPVALEGVLQPAGGPRVAFVIQRAVWDGQRLPLEVIESLVGSPVLVVDLSPGSPLPFEIEEVSTGAGRLRVRGRATLSVTS